MAVFNNILAGSSGQTTGGGYEIERSLRFNSADSAYLNRTPSVAGNRKTWTWSGWVKRSKLGAEQVLFLATAGINPHNGIWFSSSDNLIWTSYDSGYPFEAATTQVFRDLSAWYHIVGVFDTTQSTSSNRLRFYVNGVEITAYNSFSAPTQNYDGLINSSSYIHKIGDWSSSYPRFFGGYLADVHFIDGQALDPSSFGEYDDNGVWQPKAYAGSYGTNGFRLPFSNNSTAAALGTDTSANGNDWTVNNIDPSGYDYYVEYGWSGVDSYIPAGYTRTQNATDVLVNNNTGVIVNWGTGTPTDGYFGIIPTSSTVTIKWLTYDGSGNTEVTLHTTGAPNFPNAISASSSTGSASGASPRVGTWTGLTVGTTYYLRSGMVGSGNPNLVLYVTNATLAPLGSNPGCDSLVDSPTNGSQEDTGAGGEVPGNYAVINPLVSANISSLVNGNLDLTTQSSNYGPACCTVATSGSGKWYAEIKWSSGTYSEFGLAPATSNFNQGQVHLHDLANSYVLDTYDSAIKYNGTSQGSISSVTSGSLIGIAFDESASEVEFFVDGTSVGTVTATSSTTGVPYLFAISDRNSGSGSTYIFNFGQRPFAYAAPSGFKALCTANLPEPTIADGSTVMDVVTYTGTGVTKSITDLEFSPDLVWIKQRSNAGGHYLYDVIRGANKPLYSHSTLQEGSASNQLMSFDSNGFTVEASDVNALNRTHVAWTWDAGSSTVSNTDGSITSSVRANASAGFSVVTYTVPSGLSTGDFISMGHGLGVLPGLIVLKERNNVDDWLVIHKDYFSTQQYLLLNQTAAISGSGNAWGAGITSSVFGQRIGSLSGGGENCVAYCFAPVAGYSSFGSVDTNGTTDNAFIYLGFRAKFVIFKRSNDTGNWVMWDTSRNTYNVMDKYLFANSSNAEGTDSQFDILSNGIKIRTAGFASGGTYIYAAFAEHPFATARAR